MRTILTIDHDLIAKAVRLSGITEKPSLVEAGLDALITLERSKRLAHLGGTEKLLYTILRRRRTTR